MKKSLFAIAAMCVAALLTACDGGSSSSTSPTPAASSPVGTWSTSDSYSQTVLVIGADGSYSKVVVATTAGVSAYQKMSGTWTASGASLNVSVTKSESSTDGTTWTGANLPAPIATAGTFQVNGTVLSITIAGAETRYVQGTSGAVPTETVEAPVITPASGTFAAAQTVAIVSVNPGASIHYTLDGSAPSAGSTLYASPITITKTTTVKAIAVKNGVAGAVASATITIGTTQVVDSSAPFIGAWTMAASTANMSLTKSFGADGKYVTAVSGSVFQRQTGTWVRSGNKVVCKVTKLEGSNDGVTWVTQADGATVLVTDTSTWRMAGADLYLAQVVSGVAGAELLYKATSSSLVDVVAKPVFSLAAGTYTPVQSLTISASSGTFIYYTTDGKTPTTASRLYTSPIVLDSSRTIKAIAVKGGVASEVVAASYTIKEDLTSPAALVGSWSRTQGTLKENMTLGADGTFLLLDVDPSYPAEISHLRVSGTYKVSGDTLIRNGGKIETSSDGKVWVDQGSSSKADVSTWEIWNGVLTITSSKGSETDYRKE